MNSIFLIKSINNDSHLSSQLFQLKNEWECCNSEQREEIPLDDDEEEGEEENIYRTAFQNNQKAT